MQPNNNPAAFGRIGDLVIRQEAPGGTERQRRGHEHALHGLGVGTASGSDIANGLNFMHAQGWVLRLQLHDQVAQMIGQAMRWACMFLQREHPVRREALNVPVQGALRRGGRVGPFRR
jgi:hypothetical protein